MKRSTACALVVLAFVSAAVTAPARASTFDAQLYGKWSATAVVGRDPKKKIVQTQTISVTFSANGNIYYEKENKVNGRKTDGVVAFGTFNVLERGWLGVAFDPPLGEPPLAWRYAVSGNSIVILDENGVSRTFTRPAAPPTPSP